MTRRIKLTQYKYIETKSKLLCIARRIKPRRALVSQLSLHFFLFFLFFLFVNNTKLHCVDDNDNFRTIEYERRPSGGSRGGGE
jgi:hypothetical protein